MDRKPLFDVVRQFVGGRLTRQQVGQIDRAIDLGTARRSAATEPVLGALSERYECGGRGPGTVSSGKNDPGGVSYGLFQLSSTRGTCEAFMAAEGQPWRARFVASPGSAAFGQAWQAVAAAEPEAFSAAQRAFIARSHYRPAVAAVLAKTGFDFDARTIAVRDVCWSVAVQHGAAANILAAAVEAADAALLRDAAGYDRVLVEAIYSERSAHVLRVAGRPGTSPGSRRLLESIVRGRFASERAAALALLGS